MKTRNLTLCLFLVITMVSGAAFADNLSPYLEGRLNFVVDDQLIVKSMSAQEMELALKKEEMLGAHLMTKLPLSDHDRQKIEGRFVTARETQKSQVVHYWLDSSSKPGIRRYFEAKITPLNDAKGPAGFFVRVREIKLVDAE
jgi:PAS domain S-box-containing protein